MKNYEGSWHAGDRIRFLTPDGQGMAALVILPAAWRGRTAGAEGPSGPSGGPYGRGVCASTCRAALASRPSCATS
ncbi:MAG: hypothetical protein ABR506_08510 [Candidatus Krumholzibacteriia bacterium]